MRRLFLGLILVGLSSLGGAQVIDTVVGNALNDGLAATSTTLVHPSSVAIDGLGNIYVADTGNFVIRRIDPRTGLSKIVAGGGLTFEGGFALPATTVGLDSPRSLAVDADGNVYFVETRRHRVRMLTPGGVLTTVAGTGDCTDPPPADGALATEVYLCYPDAVAVDRVGNLFVVGGNRAVYRIDAKAKTLKRIAGIANNGGYSGDGGLAVNAQIGVVYSLVVDGLGNVFIGDFGNYRVRRIDADTGIIKTVAGNGIQDSVGDGGPATSASFCYVAGLTLDAAGGLIVADSCSGRVRRVDRTGIINTVAGGGPGSNFRRYNILATTAALPSPQSVAVDGDGGLYIADDALGVIVRVDALTRLIALSVGTDAVGDGGPAVSAPLSGPSQLSLDSTGNLYIADTRQDRIRRVDRATGQISTVAGNGLFGFSGDSGLATDAQLDNPRGVFVASNGDIYIADTYNTRIRRVRSGIITTVAGNGNYGFSGDGGQATSAQITAVEAVAVNAAGVIFFGDRNNKRLRMVNAGGVITTLVNNIDVSGIALDANGNLLVADANDVTVKRINVSTGTATILAGTPGQYGNSGDGGPATSAQLAGLAGIAVDGSGLIYVATPGADRVRRISPSGTITAFAGSGDGGFAGDNGPPARARMNTPIGVVADSAGNVWISDSGNFRIRKVTTTQTASALLAVLPTTLSFNTAAGQQPTPQTLTVANLNNAGMNFTTAASTTSGGSWLSVQPASGSVSSPSFSSSITVAVNTAGLAAGIYQGTITITVAGAIGSPASIPVTLTLGSNAVTKPAVSGQFLRFTAVQGDPAASQVLSVSSPSSGTLTFTAGAATANGGNWLQVAPQSGTAPTNITVTADPTGLDPGIYLGLITVRNTASAESFAVAVSFLVTAPAGLVLPSQSSFFFQANAGATQLAAQDFRVINAGKGTMSWSIQTVYPTGGSWLQLSSTSGTSAAGATVTPLQVSVNPSGLAAGAYGAVLVVSSPGATNSPVLVTVHLSVKGAGTAPRMVVEPAGLVFVGQGASAAQIKNLRISSSGGTTLPFTASVKTSDGLNWLSVGLTSGQTPASGTDISLAVTATPGQLAAGVRTGTVTITPQGGTPVDVAVSLIITPGIGPSHKGGLPVAAACNPTKQVVTPQGRLTNFFSVPVSWPATLAVAVNDDCGNPVTTSTVVANFSGEGTVLTLNSLRDGQYSGQWTPKSTSGTITVNLRSLAPPLPEGALTLTGSVATEISVPSVPVNAALNAASFAKLTVDGPAAPLTPGSIFSLFGSNLAGAAGGAQSVPLPTNIGGTQLKIGGVDAPLYYVSSGQINAQVPWELAGKATTSVTVGLNGALSGSQNLDLAPVQPGIFSTASNGVGQGAILDAQYRLVDASNPVTAGSVIQIFATGLGAVTPSVASGAASPSSPPATVTTAVTCRIGTSDAAVQFAGLAPGFVGLYQVNVTVPAGITGGAVPVVLTQAGVNSNSVTIAIK